MIRIAVTLALALAAMTSIASADDLSIGLRVAALDQLSVGGAVGSSPVGEASHTYGAKLYADWRVLPSLRVGLAIPATLNAPGPTSNEYDVGLALRVALDVPVTSSVRPYIAVEPGLTFAKLPGGEWWHGHGIGIGAGLRFDITSAVAFVTEVTVQLTNISGDVSYPFQGDPVMHGEVRVAYLGLFGAGVELHF